MPGQQERHIRDYNPKRTRTLVDRLELMFEWYKGMVDETTGRLLYSYDPETGRAIGNGEPIRDMLALLEAYRLTDDGRYLDSVERGVVHYKHGYYDPGLLDSDAMVFFANWQSQAGRPLFEATLKPAVKELVHAFLFELHDRIIASGFYDRVARRPERQSCVEVACGLEGLADAYAIAVSAQNRRTADYRRCIETALGFLVRAQRTTDCTDRERGGFGGSLASREQRIDVTGHVASSFIKSVESGITEPGSE